MTLNRKKIVIEIASIQPNCERIISTILQNQDYNFYDVSIVLPTYISKFTDLKVFLIAME